MDGDGLGLVWGAQNACGFRTARRSVQDGVRHTFAGVLVRGMLVEMPCH